MQPREGDCDTGSLAAASGRICANLYNFTEWKADASRGMSVSHHGVAHSEWHTYAYLAAKVGIAIEFSL